MIEVYSNNLTVTADMQIPFQNVSLKKGCTAELSGTSTIELNKCGVYMVSLNASAEATTTIQMYKDGVAQPEAQATGATPGFVTLVQVNKDNSCCPCASATTLYFANSTATTLTNVNVCVTKVV